MWVLVVVVVVVVVLVLSSGCDVRESEACCEDVLGCHDLEGGNGQGLIVLLNEDDCSFLDCTAVVCGSLLLLQLHPPRPQRKGYHLSHRLRAIL